jgi:protein-S-isoprenylcysteine O-methyltransferase Ste14
MKGDRELSRNPVNLKSMIVALAASIVAYIGWAMWRHPKLDMEMLYILPMREIDRLIGEPLAILGLIVMLFGIGITMRANINPDAKHEE